MNYSIKLVHIKRITKENNNNSEMSSMCIISMQQQETKTKHSNYTNEITIKITKEKKLRQIKKHTKRVFG